MSGWTGPQPPLPAGRRVAFEAMNEAALPTLLAVEQAAYSHAWTLGNFMDSLRAGNQAQMLVGECLPGEDALKDGLPLLPDGRTLVGYLVALPVLDEVHLLNLTVAPAHQRQGWGKVLMDALALWSRGQGAEWLWLEVRASNQAARALYRTLGYEQTGVRRAYYPLDARRREDAVVMRLHLPAVQRSADTPETTETKALP